MSAYLIFLSRFLSPVSVFVVVLSFSFQAHADGPDGDGPPPLSWSLGLAGITMQKPYAGIDRETRALPLVQFENRYVSIFGPEIGLKLPTIEVSDSQEISFSVIGKYDGSGYEAGDAPILNGMSRRKGGFWAGGKVEWKGELFDVSAEWLADAAGNSKGQEVSFGLERMWHLGQHVMLVPYVGASWQDKKYVDYYFGVRNGEARVDRPAYEGKAGISTRAGLRGAYMLDRQHSLLLGVEVSGLAKEIEESSLVDRSTEGHVMLGYLYRFR